MKPLIGITCSEGDSRLFINRQYAAAVLEAGGLALAAGLPTLGICRGIQILNIAAGGTVCQDISQVAGSPLKHSQQAPRWYPTHGLDLLPGSLLSVLLGGLSVRVNSFHHQAVNRIAGGFIVSARSSDGVIEGIEAAGKCFALGVQFHPKEMWERDRTFLSIFKSFVEASREYSLLSGKRV